MSEYAQAEKLVQARCGCAPGRRRTNGSNHSNECNNQTAEVATALSQARAEGRREGLEEAAKIAWGSGVLENDRASDHAPGPSRNAALWAACKLRVTAAAIRALAQKEGGKNG